MGTNCCPPKCIPKSVLHWIIYMFLSNTSIQLDKTLKNIYSVCCTKIICSLSYVAAFNFGLLPKFFITLSRFPKSSRRVDCEEMILCIITK